MTDNQRKWIEALRSGEFEQATGRLHWSDDGDAYCCLGVACILAERNGAKLTRTKDGLLEGGLISDLPEADEWLGISKDMETKLVKMNDNQHATFSEIADYAEQQLGEK